MVLLWLVAASPFADAQVQYQENISYYPLRAANWQELLEAVRQRPGQGNQAWAQTAWNASYRLGFASSPGQCRLASMEVTFSVTINLPQWLDPPPALLERWQAFSSHVKDHEYSHRQYAVDMVKALKRRLLALPPGPDCDSLKATYRRIKDELEAERDAKDRALDERDRLWQLAEQRQYRP
ncbi:DUF922 domain-containing protein [Gallaecimonas xiamenensis]|uniref:Secreted Zn-dependent protease n=1 Tax=Gallaecimonas xiamenensis 3-C-1 TaxID=745411 RepID=K2JK79_9GAMM|nr:DUF922 domain-containing protein [Gallaecimonas xiamenensis]EKE75683.1 hypothetical protein B3C1_06373 [Gallaecimonas xiamenensis 3-C-1]